MTLERSKVEKSLKKKGFVPGDSKQDHRFYYYEYEGKRYFHTKVSTGTNYKTIGKPLVGKVTRQLNLGKTEFLEFVNCQLSKKGYKERLRAMEILPKERRGER